MSDIRYFLHVSETGCVFSCFFFAYFFAGSRDIGSGCYNPMVAAGGIGTRVQQCVLLVKWPCPKMGDTGIPYRDITALPSKFSMSNRFHGEKMIDLYIIYKYDKYDQYNQY